MIENLQFYCNGIEFNRSTKIVIFNSQSSIKSQNSILQINITG